MARKVLIPFGLVVLTLTVFLQVRQFEFVTLDDPVYVAENPHLSEGFTPSTVVWAFTTFRAANWHPVTWLSHMLDVQLFGLDAGAHHLVNLILHIANTVVLFWLLCALTGATGPSAFVAAVFAVHPLHVESVAWVAERKDVLSTLFWLLATWAYAAYVRAPSRGRYLAVAALFVFGLMAKPMLVTLPLTLLLLDVWPLGRWARQRDRARLVLEKAPLFVLAAASGVITFLAQRQGGAVSALGDVSTWDRVANALSSYVAYLGQMAWPGHLAGFYPLRLDVPALQVIGAFAILAVVCVASIRLIRRAPYLFVGWWWYLITLVPVIGIVQVGAQAMADRYTYVPMIGILMMAAWGAADLLRTRPHLRPWIAAVSTALVLVLAARAHAQTQTWRDSTTFWTRVATVALDVSDVRANIEIGRVLAAQSRTTEAYDHFARAVARQPDSVEAQSLLGSAAFDLNRFDAAAAAFGAAARLAPAHAEAHQGLGRAKLAQGDAASAVSAFEEAARLQPGSAVILNDLGWALSKTGRADQARIQFAEAIRLRPDYAEPYANMGLTYAVEGKLAQALPYFTEAVRLDPGFETARVNLGRTLAALGRVEDAVRELEEALRRNPASAPAHALLEQLRKPRLLD